MFGQNRLWWNSFSLQWKCLEHLGNCGKWHLETSSYSFPHVTQWCVLAVYLSTCIHDRPLRKTSPHITTFPLNFTLAVESSLLLQVYTAVTESVLTSSTTNWYSSMDSHTCKKKLRHIVSKSSKIIGTHFPFSWITNTQSKEQKSFSSCLHIILADLAL